MYLLVFDRELAEKTVAETYPSEGPHFLEKIIQASFELPLPARDDLNMAALSQIKTLCGETRDREQLRRFMNIFYDAVSPYLNTPRDLTRLSNAMAVSWSAVAKEVDVGDYIALEIMRLFEPMLYNAIRTNKEHVCGIRPKYGHKEDPKQEIEKFLKLVPEKRRDNARVALMRLFPRFEDVGYSDGFIERWESQRLVCTHKHFDTYFRMGVGDETLSINEINEFIANTGDGKYVKDAFQKALNSIRKNGKSKVPLLFDEVNVHASKIDKTNIQHLISAIFEIADDINRDEDCERGGFQIGAHLRIHWLIRKLTFDRCSLDERSEIFLTACQNAQIGWLVDFTDSAISDYVSRNNSEMEPPEKCLVNKDRISELKLHTLKIINSAAETGKLISHSKLAYILFSWRELAEDNGLAVMTWTKGQLNFDESVSMFAKAFTGESWSQGMGMAGLGDRIALRDVRASVDGLEKIIDVKEFRSRLEKIENEDLLDIKFKRNVLVFLDAWRRKEKGKDRW